MKLAIDAQGASNDQQDEIKALQGSIEDAAHKLLLEKAQVEARAEMDAQKLNSDIDAAIAAVQSIADNFIAKTTTMHEVASAKMKASAEKAGAEKEHQAAQKMNDGHAQALAAMQKQMVDLAQSIKDSLNAKKRVSITFADGRTASAESQTA